MKKNEKESKVRVLPRPLRNVLRGAKDSYAQFSTLRLQIKPDMYPALVAWIPNLAQKRPSFTGGQFPTTFRALHREKRSLQALTVANEILWTTIVLREHWERIGDFRNHASSFEKNLLSGNYLEADSDLAKIREAHGFSFWLIESKLALLQVWKGLEAQKAYAASIREQSPPGFVAYFTFAVSERNEENTNAGRFQTVLTHNSATWGIGEDFRSYLLYRIGDLLPDSTRALGSVLRCEATGPLVDQYETIIRLATHAFATNQLFLPAFAAALPNLNVIQSDTRLGKLLFLAGARPDFLETLPTRNSTRSDQLLIGDFAPAAEWATVDKSNILDILDAAKASAQLSKESLRDSSFAAKLAGLAEKLISKVQMEETITEAARLCLNLRFVNFIPPFAEFVETQTSPLPPPYPTASLASFVALPTFHPCALYALIGPAKAAAEKITREEKTLSSIAELYRAVLSDELPENIRPEVRIQLQAERARSTGDHDALLQLAQVLSTSERSATRREAARLEAHALLEAGRVADAVESVVNSFLRDSRAATMLPVEQCLLRLDKTLLKALAGKLSTPIVIDIFTRLINDSRTSQRRYAYEDYLLKHGLQRPSQLRNVINDYDRGQLVYYLQNLCVPEVMEVSIAFNSSRDVEDERLAVCRLLIEVDPRNANEYEAEMREITKHQVIHGGVRQIEQSKISIDLEPVRRWADRTIKDSFARYQALLNAGIGPTGDDRRARAHEVLDEAPPSQDVPEVPEDEAANLLLRMLSEIVRECYLNPFHGLDCYLSMRIRHGALSGQLRAPVEEERLITQRQSSSDEYSPNDYWENRCAHIGRDRLEKLDKRLRAFSKAYDELIESFAKCQIQIRTADKKDGLFTATVPPATVIYLAHEIRPDTTFDSFLDRCFTVFWESIDASLQSVRNFVDDTLKPKLRDMFVSLMTDVDQITMYSTVPELDAAIRTAQTRANLAFDEVKDWFRQAKPLPPKSFAFKELVDIGVQQVKKIFRDFEPEVTADVAEMPRFADLSRFSDIFFIIFANVWRHSGIDRHPTIHVTAQLVGAFLTMRIVSEVGPDSVTDDARARVERIKTAIADGEYHRAVRSEGGTGLIKLRNIIRTDRERGQLDFGFEGDNKFFVQIELPVTFYEELSELSQ